MTTISTFWFMILIELLVATTIVSILLIVLNITRKQRDRKGATSLIHKVKEDEPRRTAETKKIMLNKFGFDDDAAEDIAVRVRSEEKAFYQNVINFYLRRDASALDHLNISFEGTVDSYRKLEPPGMGEGSSGKPENESKELQKLKEENKQLSEEISVTMQTMGRMLSEYSAMFAKKAQGQEDETQADKQTHEEEAVTEPDASADQVNKDVEIPNSDVESEEEAPDAEENLEEDKNEAIKEIAKEKVNMVEEMDDLSDLDSKDDDDLGKIKAPENPDDLIG